MTSPPSRRQSAPRANTPVRGSAWARRARALIGAGHSPWLLGLILTPCLANLSFILGFRQGDPAYIYSGLGVGPPVGRWANVPTWFDPAFGQIPEAQGHLAALDWLHGTIPWWNPYTGIGMPLAAEMQNLAMFQPFVMLLALHHGWLWLRLSLQMLSGITLYALLIELGTTRLAAFIAGALFGLSGAFFMIPQATGPLPFVPLLLLGLEQAARAARDRQALGWGWITIALAFMLYGGFPETAYFGGLLAAAWSLMQVITLGAARWHFVGKVALSGVLGLMISLPLVVPFLHYLAHAFLGPHGAGFAIMALTPQAMALSVLPFLFGPTGLANPPGLSPAFAASLGPAWNELGTWFGPVILLGALAFVVGLLRASPRHRAIGLTLAGFITVAGLRIIGAPGAVFLVNLIPQLAQTNVIRFISPAMDLALLILLGLAINQWQRGDRLTGRQAAWAGGLVLAMVLAVLLLNGGLLRVWYQANPGLIRFSLVGCALDIGAAVTLLIMLRRPPNRVAGALLASAVIVDALFGSGIAQFSARRDMRLDVSGVHWLQQHQRLARMFSLSPFGPNYPAAYRVASINSSQLPVDESWMRVEFHRLGPPEPLVSMGVAARLLRRHLSAYEALGVRYIIADPGADPGSDPLRVRPINLVTRSHQAVVLAGAATIEGVVPARLIARRIPKRLIAKRPISAVEVLIGTFDGAATGKLMITLCAGSDCAHGAVNLRHASDDRFVLIGLDHPLLVTGAPLHFVLSHPTGKPVAIWSAATGSGTLPALRLIITRTLPESRQVFQNKVMAIYQVPHPAPIFQAAGCRIAPRGWNRVTAQCAKPSLLIRRVAWFAGWHALVNRRAVTVQRHGRLFQAIELPAGASKVSFAYRPRDTRLTVAAAVLAGLMMLIFYRRRWLWTR